MSQGFKWKFDQMQENNPSTPPPGNGGGKDGHYAEPGSIRNVCFVWPNGRMKSLNYSYLVATDYDPEQNAIILAFTSHTVTLTGHNLAPLFHDLLMQLPKYIVCVDERYAALVESGQPVVTDIKVASNSD